MMQAILAMNLLDWLPWVVLMLLAIGIQIWTPREPHPNHELAFRLTKLLGENEHGDKSEKR